MFTKIFSIGVMRYDGVRVSPLLMFVRTILGKCTIETLIPLFLIFLLLVGGGGWFSIIGVALIVVSQIVLMSVLFPLFIHFCPVDIAGTFS